MELIVKIDLQDVWVEENLDETLKNEIKYAVVRKLREEFTKKIEKDIECHIKNEIDKLCKESVDSVIKNIIETQTIREDSFSTKRVALEEWIDKKILPSSNYITRQIEEIAKKKIESLKVRYDEAFAKGIVENMDKMGLLKDNALSKLLNK